MSRLGLLLRLILVWLLGSTILAAFSWIVLGLGLGPGGGRALGRLGVWASYWAVLGAIFFLGLTLEQRFTRLCRAAPRLSEGFQLTIRRAFEDLPLPWPLVRVFPSALPQFAVVRSWGGAGSVFVSEGLAALLSEEELRAVLRWCALRCARPGLSLQSLFGQMAIWAFSCIPEGWRSTVLEQALPRFDRSSSKEVRGLRPWSSLRFLVFFPFANGFFRLSQFNLRPEPDLRLAGAELHRSMPALSEHWFSAMRKISRAAQTWYVPVISEPLPRA
jgi:hypothetical protein